MIVSADGSVACVVQNGAALNIYDGDTQAAAPLGSLSTGYTYDSLDRLIEVTDPLGRLAPFLAGLAGLAGLRRRKKARIDLGHGRTLGVRSRT